MIIGHRRCDRCQSIHIVKNGKNASGTQTYKCKDCNCSRVLDSKQKGRHLDAGMISRTYQERQSLRGTGRLFGINHQTVQTWLKKSPIVSCL